ncbi:Srp receptor beta subunit [Coniochaeta hoffmannii]|uniref:Signal recognition particle receptor subunit beta n=1 Tax=Coniochaeta hoffmannii TaxID=91930 RepID=A0AA38S601_9PEZI|nr:Srp receptor beta subunit [Coniochaeta hoffmannii]
MEQQQSLLDMLKSFLEATLTPSPAVFIIGGLIVLLAPIILHHLYTRTTPYTSLPAVLLVGPSGAGKTALLTLLERGPLSSNPSPSSSSSSSSSSSAAQTHTSQVPASVELAAPEDKSLSFRTDLDAAGATATKFLLVDTPGHGKLRAAALSKLGPTASKDDKKSSSRLKAVVFVLDAADPDTLSTDGAEYLYDVLLALQKRTGSGKTSRAPHAVPVLVAANKLDLFTALPAALVRSRLEAELARIRRTRSKGLLGASVGADELDAAPEEGDDWLGEYGSDKFSFGQMREFDVDVDVIGGNVLGEGGPGVDKWWSWIADKI